MLGQFKIATSQTGKADRRGDLRRRQRGQLPHFNFGIAGAVAAGTQLVNRLGLRQRHELVLPARHTHHLTSADASTYAAALAKRVSFSMNLSAASPSSASPPSNSN